MYWVCFLLVWSIRQFWCQIIFSDAIKDPQSGMETSVEDTEGGANESAEIGNKSTSCSHWSVWNWRIDSKYDISACMTKQYTHSISMNTLQK